jgi:small GTP-binding protein
MKRLKEIAQFSITEHLGEINFIAFSPDGKYIASGSGDDAIKSSSGHNTIKLWEVSTGKCVRTFTGHSNNIRSVNFDISGKYIVSGSYDKTIKLWEVSTGKCVRTFTGHSDWVLSAVFCVSCKQIVSGSYNGTIKLWEVSTGKCIHTFIGHSDSVCSVNFDTSGKYIVSGSEDNTIKLWEVSTGKCVRTFIGHSNNVSSVNFDISNKYIVSGCGDKTIRLWEVKTGKCLFAWEGSSEPITQVGFFEDEQIYAFAHGLHCFYKEGSAYEISSEVSENYFWSGDYNSQTKTFAGVTDDNIIYLYQWYESAPEFAAGVTPALPTTNKMYKSAKVVLIGESGVGKSGLAHRLIEDKWLVTDSTHGMNVYQFHLPALDSDAQTEREVWLWDLAGQPEYRLVHQLFLDETAVVLLLFDATKPDPFTDTSYWLKALRTVVKRHDTKTLLVASRKDRGSPILSTERIDSYQTEKGIAGFYLTSAKTGEGCQELRDAIADLIPWGDLPHVISAESFKRLKDAVLSLRSDTEEKNSLLRFRELRLLIEKKLPDDTLNEDTLRNVLRQLSGQGIIRQLDFGDYYLLQPERLNAYASAVVRAARNHSDGIGCLDEDDVLAGNIAWHDFVRLTDKNDEEVLLRAMLQTFTEYALCIREKTEGGVRLVFPSQYNREYEIKEHPEVLVTYRFAGALEKLYTTLVVRMRYSTAFGERPDLWKNAAEFRTQAGKRLGFVMKPLDEGVGEIQVFFEKDIPDDTRVTFIGYIHDHLKKYAVPNSVERIRRYVCPNCQEPVTEVRALEMRLRMGKKDIGCVYCDHHILLRDIIEEKAESDEFLRQVKEMDATAQINLDNESRELILVGHAFVIAGEAGQIFRPTSNSDWGLDGEIEFKDAQNRATGKRIYLQLKSGDSYIRHRKTDDVDIFNIPDERHIAYWQAQRYDVYLVIRTSDKQIQWINATEYLRYREDKESRQIVFRGEPFDVANLLRIRDKIVG